MYVAEFRKSYLEMESLRECRESPVWQWFEIPVKFHPNYRFLYIKNSNIKMGLS